MKVDDIIFKADREKLIIVFNNKEKDFNELKSNFCDKLEEVGNFFCGEENRDKFLIEFKGRDFSREEEKKLIDIFYNKTKIKVELYKRDDLEAKKDKKERKSIVYRSCLRSGQFLHYDGNVILIGDVNSGAEILATGNIIVMGKIKGTVHAGFDGDRNCIITALGIYKVQIRIADIISCVSEDMVINQASCICVKNDKIYIEGLLS